jgi:two-component system, NtrC family, response regulator HydG
MSLRHLCWHEDLFHAKYLPVMAKSDSRKVARPLDPAEIPDTPSFDDLQKSLHFNPDEAEIWLDGRRMVLTENDALGIMRRELILAVGNERARAMMTRMGYELGTVEAELAVRLRQDRSIFDGFSVGPQLHALKGVVKVEPVLFDVDPENGHLYTEYYWHHSAECEAHLAQMGVGHQPGGWQQVGYASGYSSAFFGRPFIFRELECVAMGHSKCFLVGKPAEDWDDPERELRYFRAENYSVRPNTAKPQTSEADEDLKVGTRQIVGASASFNIVFHLIDKVAPTDAPVLFLGESGVGKEVFARELHIPENLVEAELFGVEKGAFTGAITSRPGRFERADGGTLFLDEIGTLTPSAQGKLLRVLQEGEYERVGGTETRKANVRLIAATNADLRADIKEGRFREDLFHRINVFPIRIAPLRERRADIPLLINHFQRRFAKQHGRTSKHFSEEALRYFMVYDWPGNVRELENIVERGVILADEGMPIDLPHLLTEADRIAGEAVGDPFREFLLKETRSGRGDSLGSAMLDSGLSADGAVNQMIRAALERTGGNVSAAAKLAGMTRSQVNYWLRQNQG